MKSLLSSLCHCVTDNNKNSRVEREMENEKQNCQLASSFPMECIFEASIPNNIDIDMIASSYFADVKEKTLAWTFMRTFRACLPSKQRCLSVWVTKKGSWLTWALISATLKGELCDLFWNSRVSSRKIWKQTKKIHYGEDKIAARLFNFGCIFNQCFSSSKGIAPNQTNFLYFKIKLKFPVTLGIQWINYKSASNRVRRTLSLSCLPCQGIIFPLCARQF